MVLPRFILGVSLIDDDDVGIWPIAASGNRLNARNLERLGVIAPPVIRLNDAVRGEPVGVGTLARLIDERRPIAHEQRTTALDERLVRYAQSKERFAGPGRCDKQLPHMAVANPLSKLLVSGYLKITRRWKARARVIRFSIEEGHHAA